MPGHLGEDRATHEIGAAEPDVVVAPFGETPGAVMRLREPVVIQCHVVVRLRTVRGPGDLAHLPSGRRRLVVRSHVDHAGMRRLKKKSQGSERFLNIVTTFCLPAARRGKGSPGTRRRRRRTAWRRWPCPRPCPPCRRTTACQG